MNPIILLFSINEKKNSFKMSAYKFVLKKLKWNGCDDKAEKMQTQQNTASDVCTCTGKFIGVYVGATRELARDNSLRGWWTSKNVLIRGWFHGTRCIWHKNIITHKVCVNYILLAARYSAASYARTWTKRNGEMSYVCVYMCVYAKRRA